jgi:hypothetical protein
MITIRSQVETQPFKVPRAEVAAPPQVCGAGHDGIVTLTIRRRGDLRRKHGHDLG